MAVQSERLWLRGCMLMSLCCNVAGCGARATHPVDLVSAERDYYLPSPEQGAAYRIQTHAKGANPKNKLVFETPIAPGDYTLELSDDAAADQTLVLSVPLSSGQFRFKVSAAGHARYDFAFHDAGPKKEYRFTVRAPVERRVFALNMPRHEG